MGPLWPHIILFCERMNVMKNANDFENSKYHTLTKLEQKLVEKVINIIIENHSDDEWWKIDTAIKSHVYYTLSLRLQDESFKEHFEEEQARLAEEEKERERIEAEEMKKEQEENEQVEKESDEIINDILSEIE